MTLAVDLCDESDGLPILARPDLELLLLPDSLLGKAVVMRISTFEVRFFSLNDIYRFVFTENGAATVLRLDFI